MVKVKFCGIRRPEDIPAINALHPDYVGFIFAKKSKRYVNPDQAADLRSLIDPAIPTVGVFVNEDPGVIASIASRGIIDLIQLHGAEDEEFIAGLRGITDKPIIKAFMIKTPADLKAAENSPADLILLDSGAGSGKTFDWSILKNIHRDYLLAGGLTPDNIASAIDTLHPYGLDMSSGIETDGFKDPCKMAAVMNIIKEKNNDQS